MAMSVSHSGHSVVSDSIQSHGLSVSSIHGILQARILERVAIPFSIYQRYPLKEKLTWELFLGRQGNLHESRVHDSQLSNSGSEAEIFTEEKN